ncbi:hypothetical protein [Romboutsia ilealis]|uniref:hypothetical protein n=1 Tax=Romboutsia ilealis TaxID=1115758 RepID=UPI00272C40A6|nr:hypothetical protein [Romboutsia ilealis]
MFKNEEMSESLSIDERLKMRLGEDYIEDDELWELGKLLDIGIYKDGRLIGLREGDED